MRWLALALLAGCATPAPRAAAPPPIDCGPPIAGLDDLLARSRFLVFGEIHGTAEVPAFFARAVCRAGAGGEAITVGVEIPSDEQGRIDGFVGGAADRDALLAAPFWQRDYQDGRSSRAMLALLTRVRELRAAGLAVRVIAFDPAPMRADVPRDTAMAEALLAARAAAPRDRFLVLTGSLHARTDVGAPWDPGIVFMGHVIARGEPGLLTLDNAYTGGTAWVCISAAASECGAQPLGGRGDGAASGIRLDPALGSWHGQFAVGAVSASPPARSDL
jgi:hypothetical protein